MADVVKCDANVVVVDANKICFYLNSSYLNKLLIIRSEKWIMDFVMIHIYNSTFKGGDPMRGLWSQLLVSFIGREFIVHLKGQSTVVSGILKQVLNDVIHYSPLDSNFSDGFLVIPEIEFIEFKPVTPDTSTTAPTTESQLQNSFINDYIL